MMQTQGKRVLLIEDDELFGQSLIRFMDKQGLKMELEKRGDRALDRIVTMQPDGVILDCNLPGADGFEVCRQVRVHYRGPIVMLTARDEDVDQVLGLGLGADDYLVKPVTPHVVLAHLNACMRRYRDTAVSTAEADEYRFGRLYVSRATRTVRLDDKDVFFSTAEFDLLWLLASRAGNVLSRDDINTALRGIEHDGLNRSIDMRISRLRKALGDDAENPVRIKTVRGKGYLFSRTDWD